MDTHTPVLVGVGLVSQREEDPLRAKEPITLMIDAAMSAAHDSGAQNALAQIERIYVPVGRWSYQNPGKLIGTAVGAADAVSISAYPGVSQQTIISDACSRIANGEIAKAMVIGGEAGYRLLRAKIEGIQLEDTESTDPADVVLTPSDEMAPDYEQRSGLGFMPVGYYAIMESAFRYAKGLDIATHRDRVAAMYSRFSEIASHNPHAWNREHIAAETIRDGSRRNAMLAFPYTKLHNASWNVDQASALLLCSVEQAKKMNVPRSQWVFPQVFTESNHMMTVTARAELHKCPGAELAGRAAFEASNTSPEQLDFLELYSCFPLAVEVYASELGIPETMDWSFTGGMPFAGGPFNNFVLHSVGQIAEHIRRKPNSLGMVTTVSGYLTKQGFAIWGSNPNQNGYQFVDVTKTVAEVTKRRDVNPDYEGPARIAGYTVMYNRNEPQRGVAVVDLPDNLRSIAYTDDIKLMDAMEREEFCGTVVNVRDGRFTVQN
jgi:acetyl-CoA C-acetyltransferase